MPEEEKYVPILSRLRAPEGAVHRKRRRGRGPGSGLGKTSGKGQKGQKARHPNKFGKLGFEGGQMPLIRRLPKRGFTNPFSKKVIEVNLRDLEQFDADETVDVAALKQAGLIKRQYDVVKILANGELTKALTIQAHAFSAGAKSKIEAAGGKAELIVATKAAS